MSAAAAGAWETSRLRSKSAFRPVICLTDQSRGENQEVAGVAGPVAAYPVKTRSSEDVFHGSWRKPNRPLLRCSRAATTAPSIEGSDRSDYRDNMTAVANSRELTIGQLSKVVQVPIETIRYWERLGLAPIPPRSRRGHRLYNDGHVRQLVILRRARRLGFGLRDLRSLLKLSAAGKSSCADVLPLAQLHLERVRAKLADLTAIERLLADAVRACSEDPVIMCPLLDLLDSAASDVETIGRAMPQSRSCC